MALTGSAHWIAGFPFPQHYWEGERLMSHSGGRPQPLSLQSAYLAHLAFSSGPAEQSTVVEVYWVWWW